MPLHLQKTEEQELKMAELESYIAYLAHPFHYEKIRLVSQYEIDYHAVVFCLHISYKNNTTGIDFKRKIYIDAIYDGLPAINILYDWLYRVFRKRQIEPESHIVLGEN